MFLDYSISIFLPAACPSRSRFLRNSYPNRTSIEGREADFGRMKSGNTLLLVEPQRKLFLEPTGPLQAREADWSTFLRDMRN